MPSLQEQTQAHYDHYPFIEGGGNRVAWWRDYLRDFLPDQSLRDKLVVDIGSSVGEISRGLLDRGARVACLDVSMQSLRRCRLNNPEADVLHASALDLPFPDEAFDHAISIGVLHHTPDCRRGFRELARVTAPGGTAVVFLYNYWNVYNLIYHSFKPVRSLVPLSGVPDGVVKIMQPFVKSHLGQQLDTDQLRNLLGDKLWTPQATFHSVAEVRRWGKEEGLTLTHVKKFFLGYANVMRFVKGGQADGRVRRLNLKCASCSRAPLVRQSESYSCPNCGHLFPIDAGIIDVL